MNFILFRVCRGLSGQLPGSQMRLPDMNLKSAGILSPEEILLLLNVLYKVCVRTCTPVHNFLNLDLESFLQ